MPGGDAAYVVGTDGYLHALNVSNGWDSMTPALFLPAKTPLDTINAINEAVRRTLAAPAVSEKLLASGALPSASKKPI